MAPDRDALNCIRILTRIIPFIYEAENLEQWEEKFFWGARRKRSLQKSTSAGEVLFDESAPIGDHETDGSEYHEVKPLAEELIDTLVDLLFFPDFTLPKSPGKKNQVTLTIWQSGVGSTRSPASNQEIDSKKMEILRLLLTIASKSMYKPASK